MPVYHRKVICRRNVIGELIGESTHIITEFLFCPFLHKDGAKDLMKGTFKDGQSRQSLLLSSTLI